MIGEAIKVTYSTHGNHFEILVKPEEALQYREGKIKDFSRVLFVQEIFKSVSTAERASVQNLRESFNSDNIIEIAERIFKNGNIELTTEQKRKLMEEKKKEIINLIARRAKNPQTNTPHPPQRIENAMNEVKINIDPLKRAEEQVKEVIDKIKSKIPLSFENKTLVLKIPNQFAGRCYDLIKHIAELKEEKWTSEHLFAKIEFPAGMEPEILEKLNKITSGSVEVREK